MTSKGWGLCLARRVWESRDGRAMTRGSEISQRRSRTRSTQTRSRG